MSSADHSVAALLHYTANLDEALSAAIASIAGDVPTERDLLVALIAAFSRMPHTQAWLKELRTLIDQDTAHRVQVLRTRLSTVAWYRDLRNNVVLTEPCIEGVLPRVPLTEQGVTVVNSPTFFDNFRSLDALYEVYLVKRPTAQLVKELTFYER